MLRDWSVRFAAPPVTSDFVHHKLHCAPNASPLFLYLCIAGTDVEEAEDPDSPKPIHQLGDTTIAVLRTTLVTPQHHVVLTTCHSYKPRNNCYLIAHRLSPSTLSGGLHARVAYWNEQKGDARVPMRGGEERLGFICEWWYCIPSREIV